MAEERKFDDVLKELETIVTKLEEADVPLEDALNYYQKGIELSKWCDDRLKSVERQVVDLIDENDQVRAFDSEDSE
ncbi:exodeoxyribonuclease 7 small subunit [Halolactibacillus alkaliphilus]|uniref:Exodeoxyribonuclease 7 small subunit n=1 Tax=Halolactibacillus alkaliphilus TaxID=442899 RepID=A0A511X2Q2_9BACI|nr:exodeoxyribonuclease VII small subunit [Halolactibacillus alkaliphilus]GEN57229.1 exodeoxyribonuclease 7 small subunit [Halolactibacillus alkaliphilus]GGN68803.1 exodeoxyribonuclease 7 small subunit [Halolactibacillus alkaliphilus]SFO73045.1 Exodeoxyribonuclease VII small subunit [Halolactibacillus alkaliphilus]